MEPPDWDAVIRPHVEGRRVILAGGPVAQWTERVELLHRLGAGPVFVLGTGSVGTGPLPADDGCEWTTIDLPPGDTHMDHIRAGAAALRHPPADVVARLDAFDPDGRALVMGDFLNGVEALAGRPFFAHRRAAWVAYEDKTTVDGLWDRAGVRREPSEVVPATSAEVTAAARRLDAGAGVVLAGDAREGWHGGAALVRSADTPALVSQAAEALAEHCDCVRVMPFLAGIPCSIHGVVLPDGVVALRPVEMVVLRKPDGRFFYAGCSTYYDPPVQVREEMREVARRVGERLREEVEFRGAFTVDGVATADGFRPTELNPRSGAGLMVIARGTGMPVQLLLDVIVAGRPLGLGAPELEAAMLPAADGQRSGGTWSAILGDEHDRAELSLVIAGDVAREAISGEVADATTAVGPAEHGTFLRTVFDPARTPVGASVGSRARAAWRFLDERYDLSIGPLLEASPAC